MNTTADDSGTTAAGVEVHPLTLDRWEDFVRLFGEKGAADGCWCMWWRQTSAEYGAGRGERNREAMRAIVAGGRVPGLIAYVAGEPAGWCSVGPREEFPRVRRSPVARPIDDAPAWAIVCFFIDRRFRGRGLGEVLLRAAVDYAVARGARLVEGYPVDPGEGRVDSVSGFHGFAEMFRAAGFREVARRREGRPIMRYEASTAGRA